MMLTENEQKAIKRAIEEAEDVTSGEIRVVIEKKCSENVLDRAAYHFKELGMHKTAERNGVLIYLASDDHQFAIIGDAGINTITGDHFWDETKELMASYFKQGKFAEGLVRGIQHAGEALKKHFPNRDGDKNELPDDIVYS